MHLDDDVTPQHVAEPEPDELPTVDTTPLPPGSVATESRRALIVLALQAPPTKWQWARRLQLAS